MRTLVKIAIFLLITINLAFADDNCLQAQKLFAEIQYAVIDNKFSIDLSGERRSLIISFLDKEPAAIDEYFAKNELNQIIYLNKNHYDSFIKYLKSFQENNVCDLNYEQTYILDDVTYSFMFYLYNDGININSNVNQYIKDADFYSEKTYIYYFKKNDDGVWQVSVGGAG